MVSFSSHDDVRRIKSKTFCEMENRFFAELKPKLLKLRDVRGKGSGEDCVGPWNPLLGLWFYSGVRWGASHWRVVSKGAK